MGVLRETAGTLRIGVALHWARVQHTLLTAACFLVAAMVLVILLTIPAGMAHVADSTGLPDVAIVLSPRAGVISEADSSISSLQAAIIGTLPGVARDRAGRALIAAQLIAQVELRQRDGGMATVLVRGISPAFWNVIGSTVSITSGKLFSRGTYELIGGRAAAQRFVALEPGTITRIRDEPWRVTGTFSAGESMWDTELWTSIGSLQAAYNESGNASVVWVKLTSPAAFRNFSDAVSADPRLRPLVAVPQRSYYRRNIGFVTHFANIAVMGVATALGLGTLLAVFNALGIALVARQRETAVLRALGFHKFPIALALLAEVSVIALVCAGIAIMVSWLTISGLVVNSSTFEYAMQFSLRLTTTAAWSVVVYTLALGVAGALWPVIRTVRASLTHSLQGE